MAPCALAVQERPRDKDASAVDGVAERIQVPQHRHGGRHQNAQEEWRHVDADGDDFDSERPPNAADKPVDIVLTNLRVGLEWLALLDFSFVTCGDENGINTGAFMMRNDAFSARRCRRCQQTPTCLRRSMMNGRLPESSCRLCHN